ncbi:phage major tail protein, TP901-1 family [Oceanobacillus limi]|uniref:Phage major tail protein, TP901-1 family n=1 Tax=Oceanobacillus limi TaxID=930131 RepID=A0A1I0GEH5_9BACI|nr:phage major tail protein, TP901-1 family [Oceanobacillus limi]SET69216.1 phage major tail protein, TP901-1 family [Oceanobacillus limi]
MAAEYRGDEFLYLVEIEEEDGSGSTTKTDYRPFNQTNGSNSIEADSIDLNTKDKTGSDYSNVTESLSLEGVFTENDPAIPYIKKSIRQKKLVKITTVNTRTLDTEFGKYKLDSFEQSNSNGEFATYSLEATLNGDIQVGTLTEVPEGAPDEA